MSSDQTTGEDKRVRSLLWTPANGLTLLRLILAPVNAVLIIGTHDLLAALVFAIAVASDLADGPLARRRGETTAFGSLLDHGTDAVFVTLGVWALSGRGLAPPVLAPLIALAFIQYTLDSRALAGEKLRASILGRWNGILYFALLGTPVIRNATGLTYPDDRSVVVLGWLLVFSTVISMINRILALLRIRRAR